MIGRISYIGALEDIQGRQLILTGCCEEKNAKLFDLGELDEIFNLNRIEPKKNFINSGGTFTKRSTTVFNKVTSFGKNSTFGRNFSNQPALNSCTDFAVSRNGNAFVINSEDKIKVYDVSLKKSFNTVTVPFQEGVGCMNMTSDGRYLAVSSFEGDHIHVLDLRENRTQSIYERVHNGKKV